MSRSISRRQRQMPLPIRRIRRRSKPNEWQYTYDYDNKEFLEYFRSTTGIQCGLELKRSLSHFLATSPNADHWLRTSKDYRYVKSKKTIPFGKDREDTIRWHKILRDNLQKHWEIYLQQNKRKIIRRR